MAQRRQTTHPHDDKPIHLSKNSAHNFTFAEQGILPRTTNLSTSKISETRDLSSVCTCEYPVKMHFPDNKASSTSIRGLATEHAGLNDGTLPTILASVIP